MPQATIRQVHALSDEQIDRTLDETAISFARRRRNTAVAFLFGVPSQ